MNDIRKEIIEAARKLYEAQQAAQGKRIGTPEHSKICGAEVALRDLLEGTGASVTYQGKSYTVDDQGYVMTRDVIVADEDPEGADDLRDAILAMDCGISANQHGDTWRCGAAGVTMKVIDVLCDLTPAKTRVAALASATRALRKAGLLKE